MWFVAWCGGALMCLWTLLRKGTVEQTECSELFRWLHNFFECWRISHVFFCCTCIFLLLLILCINEGCQIGRQEIWFWFLSPREVRNDFLKSWTGGSRHWLGVKERSRALDVSRVRREQSLELTTWRSTLSRAPSVKDFLVGLQIF